MLNSQRYIGWNHKNKENTCRPTAVIKPKYAGCEKYWRWDVMTVSHYKINLMNHLVKILHLKIRQKQVMPAVISMIQLQSFQVEIRETE